MRPEPDRHERVDLIDVDPEVFVDSASRHDRPSDRPRQVLKAIGLLAVIAVAVAIWWPRTTPPEWQVFQPAVVPAAGLTEELVFDNPPGMLVAADLGPGPADVKPELGYVFAGPGGTMLTRRWASFRAKSTNLPDVLAPGDGVSVGDVAVEVRRVRVRHYLEWGPLDGHTWTATTNLFDQDEAIEFANHVAIIEERPALAHRYELGEMQPIGSTAALDCVVMLTSLLAGDRLLGPVMPTVLTWATAGNVGSDPAFEGAVSLSSISAPSDALPLVEFVLGAGRSITIHGLPAVVVESKVLGPIVAWLEDGRLIMVAGERPDEDLITLAESVRPATSGEWRVASRTASRSEGDVSFGFDLREPTTLYRSIDPDTGNVFAITVQPSGNALLACIEESNAGGRLTRLACSPGVLIELPLLSVEEPIALMNFEAPNDRRFLLAMVDSEVGDGAEVRVKLADGTWTLPLIDFGPDLPGWAVATLLPADYGVIQLIVEGKVAAAI